MGLSGIPMDSYEWGTSGFNVEIPVIYFPCQDISGDTIGSPAGST